MRLIILVLTLFLAWAALGATDSGRIRVIGIQAPITPMTAHFIHRNLEEAPRQKDRLVLIEMDTPGGLDTAMRETVRDIMASPVPVVVYVAPSGARAASAGAIIAMAADVCAMAPGTTIGAAHPVNMGGKSDKTMETKMVNDAVAYAEGLARARGRDEEMARQMVRDSLAVSADRALSGKLIDLIARDRTDLLRQLEGRKFKRDGREMVLQLTGAEVLVAEMSRVEQILSVISNPNIAYILMMLGMMGLFFELSNPGAILPGVIGGISLILAFFAFQALPINYAGVLLILLALVLFVAEIKIESHGMLTVGGVVAMIFGSLLLFESSDPFLRASWNVIVITALSTAGFFAIVVAKGLRVHRLPATTGRDGLIGEEGTAASGIAQDGKVVVHGEYWDAWSDEPIAAGNRISVEKVDGMRLKVKKIL